MQLPAMFERLVAAATLQGALPAEGDRIVLREADALMRPIPVGGEQLFAVGATLKTGLLLEETACPVFILIEPAAEGGSMPWLLEGIGGGLWDGTRPVPGFPVGGDIHLALDGLGQEIAVERPGPHILLALIADAQVPPAIVALNKAGSAYWSELAGWAMQNRVKCLKREFTGV